MKCVYSENEITTKNSKDLKTDICTIPKIENGYFKNTCRYHFDLSYNKTNFYKDYKPVESSVDENKFVSISGIRKDFISNPVKNNYKKNIIYTIIENNEYYELEKINEWIKYHLNIGYNDIFIYITSTDFKIIDSISSNFTDKIHIFNILMKDNNQNELIIDFYQRMKPYFDSMTYLKVNEYLILKKWNNIHDMIKNESISKSNFLILTIKPCYNPSKLINLSSKMYEMNQNNDKINSETQYRYIINNNSNDINDMRLSFLLIFHSQSNNYFEFNEKNNYFKMLNENEIFVESNLNKLDIINFEKYQKENFPEVSSHKNTKFNIFSNNNKNSMKIAICAIAKMENDYINDWCRYHFDLGFDDIYIYDNNDEDYEPVESRIDKDILSRVHIIKVPGKRKDFQRSAYNSFIEGNYLKYDWCAFIDLDEFFVLKKWKNIKDLLSQETFEKAEEIKFEWHLYGDNDEIKQDTTIPIYKRITKEEFPKYRGNHLSKPIIKGKKKFNFISHHFAINIDGTFCQEVNIYGEYLNKTEKFVDKRYEDAYIAHYMTKTLDEFINQKFKRIEHNYDNPTNLMSQEEPFIRFQYFFNVNRKTPEKLAYIKEKLNVDFIELENGEYKMYEPGIKYWNGQPNAGDYFAIYLTNKLKINGRSSIAIMGNILSFDFIKDTKYFWGCSSTNGNDPIIKDINRYYAVGGNKTLNILSKFGDISKIVVCNPALLASFLYKPKVEKKYKLCILSHWQDYDVLKYYATNEINVIHMKSNDIESILDKINECHFTISTSLHGLVFSHSYGIKTIKLNLDNNEIKPIFKYEDYYSSINKEFKQINIQEFNMIINSNEKFKELKESISIPSSLEIAKKQLEYLSVSPVQNILSHMKNIICTFIENNEFYEQEKIIKWVKYYLNIGYSNIFIFNENPNFKNIDSILSKIFIDKVHLFNVLNEDKPHDKLIIYFYQNMNRNFESMTYLKMNEYIILKKWNNIHELMKDETISKSDIIILNTKHYNKIFSSKLINIPNKNDEINYNINSVIGEKTKFYYIINNKNHEKIIKDIIIKFLLNYNSKSNYNFKDEFNRNKKYFKLLNEEEIFIKSNLQIFDKKIIEFVQKENFLVVSSPKESNSTIIKNNNKNSMKIAICAIAKMENDYINDWCRYHFDLGFDDIYIYDNNDEDYEPVESRIDKDILSRVHIIKVPGIREDFQRNAYNSFIEENNTKYDWCAFIDLDEFFVLKKWKSIKDFLSQEIFEKAEEIKFEWHLYGDNDEIKQDTTIPIYKRITKEEFPIYRGNHICKPIIKGNKKFSFISHHFAINIDGTFCQEVNIYGEYLNMTGRFVDRRYEDAYIAHYMTKTLDEFINQKFKRIEYNYLNSTNLMAQEEPFIRFQYFFNVNRKTPEKLAYIKEKLNVDFIELENGEYKMYEPGIKYWNGQPNAGDYFAIYLTNKLKINGRSSIAIMGNILSFDFIKDTKYFWGCSSTNGNDPIIKDINRYYAVGGNKTLNILSKFGDISKIVVCNPALLASFLYKPKVEKKYKLCILSHWQDYDVLKYYATNEINVIHMKSNDIESILDKINECHFTISTSLHGLVFSHSYGIKTIKLNLDNNEIKPIFKYEDYYSSINKEFKQINIQEFNMIINSNEKFKELKESISIPSSLEIAKKQLEYLSVSPVQNIFSHMKNVICTFIENDSKIEKKNINKWINYHINMGFSDIFIFNSKEQFKNIENIIEDHIRHKIHIFNVLNENNIKNKIESYLFQYMNSYFESVSFIDINKYINLKFSLPN